MSEDGRRETGAPETMQDYLVVDEDGQRSDLEWVGLAGAQGHRKPWMYDPDGDEVYEAEIDDEEGAVRVDESEKRELAEDETLGDHLEHVGDELGWSWLSDFAHEHFETHGHGGGMEVIDRSFERRVVADDAEADLGFSGSYTYRDDDGRVHTVERQFDVFTDPDRRTSTDQPVVVVDEAQFAALPPAEETRAGDVEREDESRREFVVDLDPDAEGADIEAFCKRWHENHPDPL